MNVIFIKANAVIEKYAVLILIAFIVITNVWLGFVLFKNPFIVAYNSHEAPYFVQMYHNLINGNGPETSMYYKQPPFLESNPYYYASIFAVRQWWSSLGLLALLYSLYPVPPMHIYAVILVVVSLGCTGIYMAVRSLGATKTMSLLAAVGYVLLPQVEHLMFLRGEINIVGLGFLPLVFAALFRRSWGWFYFMCLLYATINYPHIFFIMFLGIIVAVFFKAWKQGIIAVLIGLAVLLWDNAVLRQAICGIYNEPNYFTSIIFNRITSDAFLTGIFQVGLTFTAKYITFLLMAVSFLPLLGIRREGKWNMEVIGILLFMLPFFGLSLVYDFGFFNQRNDVIIVPIYLSAVAAYMSLKKATGDLPNIEGKLYILRSSLIAGIISVSLFATAHFPWVVNYTCPKFITKDYYGVDSFNSLITEQKKNLGTRIVLDKVAEHVPSDASVAINVYGDIRAYITNRRKAWIFPDNPPGVEYYIIEQGVANQPSSDNMNTYIKAYRLFNDTDNYKIIYVSQDDKFFIIKNLHTSPIPENKDLSGWKVISDALLMKRCKR